MTTEQREFLLNNSANHTIKEMQAVTNMTRQCIYSFISKRGLSYKQHPDCKYKNKDGVVAIDFNSCPITGLKYWN